MSPSIQFDIAEEREFADGHSFGSTGPYTRLTGRAIFAVDPAHTAYRTIVDLDKAPRNDQGLVEFATDICILKPVDPAKGNQRLFYAYGNRGNKRELQFFNDAPASNDPITLAHSGNGYLMRRGYTILWAAWEGDLLPGNGRMMLDVPIATEQGKDITGLVRSEYIVSSRGVSTLPLSGYASTRSYPAVSLDTTHAQLTRRRYPHSMPDRIDPSAWCFARVERGAGLDAQGAEEALVPSDIHIHLYAGFETGWIYELVYTAKSPRVHGLGHTVVRDLVSYFKYDVKTAGESDDSPIQGIEKAYAWGRSQTGRCLRDFVYCGFNADSQGRRVFDGIMPHVSGGGLMWMNHRFSRVVSPAGQQYEDHYNCADRFPFSYASCTDHLTKRTDGILKRPDTDPLVVHTQSATEYWQRRGSLVHTDTQGNDLKQPDNTRVYLWSSSQHFADPNLKQASRGVCQQFNNIVSTSMFMRAMLDALDAWATDGTLPPDSRVPRRDDNTLVDFADWHQRFPAISGVSVPTGPSALPLLDFGRDFEKGLLTQEPPVVADATGYTIMVPATDSDGNDIAGVRAPMVQAPLGTYTGWCIRAREFGQGAMFEFSGSYIPFADSSDEQAMTQDPRPSIDQRYASKEGYIEAIRAAAETLVEQRLMIDEDIETCVHLATDWGRPRHVTRLT